MDEKEKQQALEEEQARLQALKVTSPLSILPNLFETGRGNSHQVREHLGIYRRSYIQQDSQGLLVCLNPLFTFWIGNH